MSEKLQLGIYRLKEELKEDIDGNLTTRIVDIAYLNDYFMQKEYQQQLTQQNLSNDFNVYLFYKRNVTIIRWKEFIENIANANEAILENKTTSNENYIMILENNRTNRIYATTGGYGYTALQGIAEEEFGLEILSRLIKEDDKTLRSTKEKNLVGGILGEVKFFRSDYNLNENENFGNFYKEIHSSLNKNVLTTAFNFSDSDISSNCLCVAKNSFTIKKSIKYIQLFDIILGIEDLLINHTPNVDINGVVKITKNQKELTENLNKKIDSRIFNHYKGNSGDENVDLCHKDFDKYLHADNFYFSYKRNGNIVEHTFDEPIRKITQVLERIIDEVNNLTDRELKLLLNEAHITTKDNSGDIQTYDLLRNHFYTEVEFDRENYFLLDKEWYKIKPLFTNKLNLQCQDFIDNNTSNIYLEPWNYPAENENDFNAKHIGKNNYLVFDRITTENIEMCDILHWDSDKIYFIHVKAGFNNSMRDLSNQVFIAARRIKEDIKTNFSFIKKLYETINNSSGASTYNQNARNQFTNLNRNDFIDLFRNRKPIFVLAVIDTAITRRLFCNIDRFKSNIAKFSLNELVKSMRNLDIKLEIKQL